MNVVKKFIPVSLFYIVLIISFFVPIGVSKTIVIIDFILFVGFLVVLNNKANRELDNDKFESLWNLVINIVAFSIIQLVLLYGLIGWMAL